MLIHTDPRLSELLIYMGHGIIQLYRLQAIFLANSYLYILLLIKTNSRQQQFIQFDTKPIILYVTQETQQGPKVSIVKANLGEHAVHAILDSKYATQNNFFYNMVKDSWVDIRTRDFDLLFQHSDPWRIAQKPLSIITKELLLESLLCFLYRERTLLIIVLTAKQSISKAM